MFFKMQTGNNVSSGASDKIIEEEFKSNNMGKALKRILFEMIVFSHTLVFLFMHSRKP
jgi:hypothetical protein